MVVVMSQCAGGETLVVGDGGHGHEQACQRGDVGGHKPVCRREDVGGGRWSWS